MPKRFPESTAIRLRTPVGPVPLCAAMFLLTLGCTEDTSTPAPIPVPDAPGAAFYEPAAVCVTHADTEDTLFVFNLGTTETLVVTPTRVPAGSSGLDGELEIDPETGFAVVWQWDPAGPYPVLDTLSAQTNDPLRPVLSVPFRREDPAINPPDRVPQWPVLGSPADGTTVTYPDTVVDLRWSSVQSCGSSAVEYLVELSEKAHFPPPVQELTVPGPIAQIIFDGDGADRGKTVYWRIRTRLTSGLRSAATAPRSVVHD